MSTIIVGTIVIGLIIFAVYKAFKNRHKCCNCDSCSSHCHSYNSDKQFY